jgi:hypothetical protein
MTQIREEELKNRIARDYFSDFDCTQIIGNIDFCVPVFYQQKELLSETESFSGQKQKKVIQTYINLSCN